VIERRAAHDPASGFALLLRASNIYHDRNIIPENHAEATMNAVEDTQPVALITGAGRGIGFAIARTLGARGMRIALNDLRLADAEQAATSLTAEGIRTVAVCGNVTVSADADAVVAHAERAFGRLDVLVNNAGILRPTRAESIPDEEWDLVLNGNLKSTFLCCRAAIPALRRAGGGAIVNMSSSAGKSVSTIGGAHYTAAKAGVLGLTRHLARELARDQIRVNAVCPGLIDTEMVRSTIADARIKAYAASFPMQRLGQPGEVADLVAFLASPQSSYITGASFDINGGDLTI
jgi:NAD(P)-dependent dehydrogenase (short-subunit alcohol dehydrogenase family)